MFRALLSPRRGNREGRSAAGRAHLHRRRAGGATARAPGIPRRRYGGAAGVRGPAARPARHGEPARADAGSVRAPPHGGDRGAGGDARLRDREAARRGVSRPGSRRTTCTSPRPIRCRRGSAAGRAGAAAARARRAGGRRAIPSPAGPQVPPFNGYTGDGDVTAEVVYVNYGLIEDYKTLDSLGVSVRGKIAIARYGRSFRGIKAREAERHGAVGLIMYSDPQDDGYFRGDVYPRRTDAAVGRHPARQHPQHGRGPHDARLRQRRRRAGACRRTRCRCRTSPSSR